VNMVTERLLYAAQRIVVRGHAQNQSLDDVMYHDDVFTILYDLLEDRFPARTDLRKSQYAVKRELHNLRFETK
jgi:hypothetical protein